MPKDGTVHELTSNVRGNDLKHSLVKSTPLPVNISPPETSISVSTGAVGELHVFKLGCH